MFPVIFVGATSRFVLISVFINSPGLVVPRRAQRAPMVGTAGAAASGACGQPGTNGAGELRTQNAATRKGKPGLFVTAASTSACAMLVFGFG